MHGAPKIVLGFVRNIRIFSEHPYVFSISTCGKDEGNSTKLLQKVLPSKSLSLDSAFSLVMPSNYVIGGDVSPQNEEKKSYKMQKKDLLRLIKLSPKEKILSLSHLL